MTRRRAAVFPVAIAVIALVAVGVQRSGRGSEALPRRRAPELTALRRELGHPVLLSFLNTQAEAARDPSRAQIVFLKSMDTQHRADGLRTVIVDAAGVAGAAPAGRKALINFAFDWALPRSIAVVGDEDGSIARAYAVTRVPTTFLIDGRGTIRRRWNGFALAAQLDFAIRPLVGRALVGP